MSKKGTIAGLSESFEVDSWVVKVSGQSRDILFKKAIGKEMLSRVVNQWSVIFGGDAFFQASILSVNKTWKAVLGF